jgi:hypothetical protein
VDRVLDDYRAVVGDNAVSQLRQLAGDLAGAKVVHVNSTKSGGGVAEILDWLIPLMNDLGLDASWEVIEGNPDYFNTTKAFHNGLQGNNVALTQSMLDAYETTVAPSEPKSMAVPAFAGKRLRCLDILDAGFRPASTARPVHYRTQYRSAQ